MFQSSTPPYSLEGILGRGVAMISVSPTKHSQKETSPKITKESHMVTINEVIGWIVRYDHLLTRVGLDEDNLDWDNLDGDNFDCQSSPDSDLTPWKLQKLLYYAQGHHLAEFGEPLFEDDFMAWEQGPVVPSSHHHLKTYLEGNQDVVGLSVVERDPTHPKHITETVDRFLKRVMTYYNRYSPWGLRTMIQEEGPWLHTQNGDIISREALKQFFGQEDIKNKLKGQKVKNSPYS